MSLLAAVFAGITGHLEDCPHLPPLDEPVSCTDDESRTHSLRMHPVPP